MVVDVFYIVCRSHAIACVNQFIVTRTQALMVHIGTFIEVDTFFFSEFKAAWNLHLVLILYKWMSSSFCKEMTNTVLKMLYKRGPGDSPALHIKVARQISRQTLSFLFSHVEWTITWGEYKFNSCLQMLFTTKYMWKCLSEILNLYCHIFAHVCIYNTSRL